MRKRITANVILLILPTVVLAGAFRSPEYPNTRAEPMEQRLDRFLITGQVLDENRQPVAGAYVAAHPDSLHGKLPMATTDNQGRFSIPVYKTGPWTITANKPAQGYPMMSSFYYPLAESVPKVIVKEDESPPFVKVNLLRAAKLNVRIVNQESGQSMHNAQIGLCRIEAPRFCHRQNIAVRNGQFEVLVPLAPILIQISAAGYEDWYIRDNNDSAPKPLLASSSATTELNVFLKKGDSGSASLEAPHPYSPPDGTELFHYPRLTRLEWLAVPGAETYTVEVDVCLGGYPAQKECRDPRPLIGLKVPPMAGIQGTSYEFSFLGNQPGRWRVWAVDTLGRPGRKSDWTTFFYRL